MADKTSRIHDVKNNADVDQNYHDNTDTTYSQEIWPRQGATFRTSAGNAAPGQTIKTFSSSGGVSINTGATVTVYTVTPGKTFYPTDIHISTDSATALLVQVKAGSTVILEGYISTTAPLDLAGIESQVGVGSGVVLSIVFPTVAGKNGAWVIFGFEQ